MIIKNNILDEALLRSDFPILQKKIRNKEFIYLDNSATTQKPISVINAISSYYFHQNANVNRGAYQLSEVSSEIYSKSRESVRNFIHASKVHEIIFTRGCTEAINLIAQSYGAEWLKKGDEIILSVMEHHSNIIPWQIIAEKTGARLHFIEINDKGEIDLNAYKKLLSPRTKLIAIAHISNVLGTINPIKDIVNLAHHYDIPVLVDGAQAAPHIPVNVQELDCDFYTFSGHKLYAPMGIGVLYGKERWLEKMPPYQTGGGMVSQVSWTKASFKELPEKFEAGTPNVADAVGLMAAIQYLQQFGLSHIETYENQLLNYVTEKLNTIDGLKIIGNAQKKAGVISFIMDYVHPHDIATILDQEGIAIRAGHHCAMPLMEFLNVSATARVSLGIYNTKKDIDALIMGLQKVQRLFRI